MTANNDHTVDIDIDVELNLAAAGYDIPRGDIDRVVGRARRRDARTRRLTALGATMALLAAGVGFQNLLGDEDDSETPLAIGADVVRGVVGVSWRVASPNAGLGFSTTPSGTDALYALSTAPGERDFGKARRNGVIWRSEDGVDWTAASTLGSDLYLSDLAASDGRIYAVGTTSATAAPGTTKKVSDVVAGWSDDDGKTFAKSVLPFDVRPLAAKTTTIGVGSASIATGPRGTLIVLTPSAALDVPRLLPEGIDAPNGWVTTGTGVDLLGEERNGCPEGESPPFDKTARGTVGEMGGFRCVAADGRPTVRTPQQIFGVTASYTFEHLGVTGELLDAVRRQPVVFFAEPGSTSFSRVRMPGTAPMYGPALVDAHEAGFEIVASAGSYDTGQTVVALRSENGMSFTTSESVPDLVWTTAIGRVRGVTTIVGGTETGTVIVQSSTPGRWTSRSLASAVDPDALGNRQAHAFAAGIGDFGIVAAVSLMAPDGEGGELQSTRVLASRDGLTWSDTPLDELVDGKRVRHVSRVVVTDQRAVLTVGVGDTPAEGQGPTEQIAVIGVAT